MRGVKFLKRLGIKGQIIAFLSLALILAASGVMLARDVLSPATTAAPDVVPASIAISPEESYNPVLSQHSVTARVLTASGTPAKGATVEWILNRFPGAVGDIVSVAGGSKIDNTYAISKADDNGEAKLVITATRPGDTDITAFAPDIKEPSKHKVFATKHWLNLQVQWPPDATNQAGSSHKFTVRLLTVISEAKLGTDEGWTTIRRGAAEGAQGYKVRWTVVDDDPSIYFSEGGSTAKSWTSTSDANGDASVIIKQTTPKTGENVILAEVLAPDGVPIYRQELRKSWTSPTVVLSKSGPATALTGSEVTYVISVRNTGNSAATNLQVKDTLPTGMTYVRSEPSGQVSGRIISWNLGTLPASGSSQVTVVAKATQSGTWTNEAVATVAESRDEIRASATTVVSAPSIDLQKTGPDTRYQMQEADYVITVKNTGDIVLNDVKVVDTIPAGMSYVRSSPAGSVAGKQVTWNLGSLNAGETKQFNITLRSDQSGSWTNSATVTSREGPTDSGDKTTVVSAPSIDLQKTGPGARYLQQEADYVITVKNTGAVALNDVKVVDTIPAGMSYVRSSPAGSVAGKQVAWSLGSLNAGESKQVEVTLRCDQRGSWTNTATVTTREGATDTGEKATLVVAEAGVTISSTDKVDPVAVGEQTTYVITIRNQGKIDVHNLVIVNTIASQTKFVSATGPVTFAVADGKVTFQAVPTLEAGKSLTYEITVQAITAGFAINRATLTYAEFGQPVVVEEGTTIFKID